MAEDEVFDALADPVRREILAVLAEQDELSAGDLAQRIERVGRTTVSSHLRILRTAGLITEDRRGRHRFYAIDTEGAARDVIRLLQRLLEGSADAARAAVEEARRDDDGATADRAGGQAM